MRTSHGVEAEWGQDRTWKGGKVQVAETQVSGTGPNCVTTHDIAH